jgi:hypothetical protein
MKGDRDAEARAKLRSLIGRLGAYEQHARHDPRETTRAGRIAFMKRFEDQVDPERLLPEAERKRRAEAARKAYFTRLAIQSVKARRKK